jgi:hypothetical protein
VQSFEPMAEAAADQTAAEAEDQPVVAESDAGVVDAAPAETSGAPVEPPDLPAAEPADDSPYRATLEEPDWLSEEEMGTPSEPLADDRWGSADAPAGPAGASWSLWDTEPSAASDAEHTTSTAETEADAAPPDEVSSAPAAPAPAGHADEEPVLWLGAPNEADAGATDDEGDNAAAEMEVAATGWQSTDRERATEARGDVPARELPGSNELEDALAALRRMASDRSAGDDPDVRRTEDRRSATAPSPVRDPGEAGPAQRAYARLRRILPR